MSLKISMGESLTVEGGVWRHPTLTTNVTGGQKFCACSYCKGECGLPALFIRVFYDMSKPLEKEHVECSKAPCDEEGRFYHDYKAHGSMVAAGPIWQRETWEGKRVFLPKISDVPTEKLIDMWWP